MSSKTIPMTGALAAYVAEMGVREHPVLQRCREETAALGTLSVMQIAPEQGAFMGLLARLMDARRYIEIGTFTGYSALSIALALPEDGQVDALDINDEFMNRARNYWKIAGQEHKIKGHVGPALETLDRLIHDAKTKPYDFAFIDADKTGYDAYYERILTLLRPGGLIVLDNVLWSGNVANLEDHSPDTVALRALNAKLKGDERVDVALLPMVDGIFLCRKR
ncbi:MAG: class I SAM-dependent methyltransferase [Alphaproteobacteria bacterium]|nr:class I SAM-dependent methyltransferase [Alphaproteobacteria bacterium]